MWTYCLSLCVPLPLHTFISMHTSFTTILSAPLYLTPSLFLSCWLHFPLSSPAVDRIEVRALWPVEQVTALTGPWFHSWAFCHLHVGPSHFNNVNMGQAQATENILCPGAHSLEPRCTPEPHMHSFSWQHSPNLFVFGGFSDCLWIKQKRYCLFNGFQGRGRIWYNWQSP